MHHDPTPDYPPEYWIGHPVIDQAEAALRHFGNDLTREQAERLLPMWVHYSTLTDRERAAVLQRFDADDSRGWVSGPMGGTP